MKAKIKEDDNMLHANGDHFSDNSFWRVVRTGGRTIPFLRDALAMYYCWADPATPLMVKRAIVVALLYFVSPLDATPDFIPILGWLDDAGVIAATMAAIRMYVAEEHWQRADWFFGTMPAL